MKVNCIQVSVLLSLNASHINSKLKNVLIELNLLEQTICTRIPPANSIKNQPYILTITRM